MSFNALPDELVELIIDNIAASPADYRRYSLVSRQWLGRCRHHGFRTITFSSSSVNLDDLPQSIAESISPFVHEFIVQMNPRDLERFKDMESCKNTALLTNLERVTINGARFTDNVLLLYQSLLAAVRENAPTITISGSGPIGSSDFREYVVPLLCEASELHLPSTFHPVQDHGPHLWSIPPQAKHLTLAALEASTLEMFGNMFLVPGPIRLRSLFINGWCSQWQRVLRNIGPSLEHLVLLTSNHQTIGSGTHLDTSIDLSASSGLKTLGYEIIPQNWSAALPVSALFTVSADLAVKFLIHAHGKVELWLSYRETIERLAATHPRASFQVYNYDFDPLPGDPAHILDPTTFMQQNFPELHRNGRLTYMPKGLRYYTPSDLE